MEIHKSLIFCAIVCLSLSCSKAPNEDFAVGRNEQENLQKERQQKLENSLTEANKIISAKEEQRILAYAERRGLKLNKHSGIYYEETKKGNGVIIDENKFVKISYNAYYLNGNKVEDSQQVKTFKVGGDTDIVFGLRIAVKQLSKGSKACVIVPDNMAFWLDENGEKQEADATLVYDIEIIDVE